MEQFLLFDLEPQIKRAIENLKLFEEMALKMNPEGYYLSFSGGKDSQVIYHLAQMAGVRFKAHYYITTVDPPELVRFIRDTYPDVERERPKTNMWNLIVKKQFPPTRKIRYCCSELKEHGGEGSFVITGVRWAESESRKKWDLAQIQKKDSKIILLNNDNHEKRRLLENCVTKGKYILNPIIDWTVEEVWCFLHRYVQTYCTLYDCGFSRLGCIGCPMTSVRKRKWELQRYPKYQRLYLKTFERMLQERTLHKEENYPRWKSAEEVYDWWIFGSGKKESQVQGQYSLDFIEDEPVKDSISDFSVVSATQNELSYGKETINKDA